MIASRHRRSVASVSWLGVSLLGIILSTAACAGGGTRAGASSPSTRHNADGSPTDKGARANPTLRAAPPPSGAGKTWAFPAAARKALPNGTTLLALTANSLPVVEMRVVVRAGAGFAAPGVAELTAELLRDASGKTLERLEALGASLSIEVGFDATTFALAVTTERAEGAARLLADMLQKPRFDESEFKRLRDRKTDQAEDAVRGGGSLVAMRVAMRELLAPPYTNVVATGGDFAKITPAAVREFYDKFYGARNISVIVAGAIDGAPLRAVEASFGRGSPPREPAAAKEPAAARYPSASPAKPLRVVVCDRPQSAQSDVFVLTLAPERQVESWPALRVANQVLGGGVSSRLFADVREARGLAYAVRSQIVELARGPQLFTVYAGTKTAKTAETVGVLLEQIAALGNGVSAEETAASGRFLHDVFAVRVDGIGALADLVATSETLRLGDDYWNRYRASLAGVTKEKASAAAKTLATVDSGLIVVSGDASALEGSLTRFGEVVVVSPEDDFKVVRTLPKR